MKRYTLLLISAMLIVMSSSLFAQDCAILDSSIAEKYSGKCKKGLAQGEGIAEGVNKYQGNFKKGMKHKKGTYTWADGGVYTGEFFEDKMHGEGVYIDKDSLITRGYWKNDKFVGLTIDDFNGYKILSYTNLLSKPRFRKMGEGDEIIILIDDINKSVVNLNIINYTSGQIIRERDEDNADNSTRRRIRMIDVQFPYSAILKYRVANKTDTAMIDVEVSFRIVESGVWSMSISHN